MPQQKSSTCLRRLMLLALALIAAANVQLTHAVSRPAAGQPPSSSAAPPAFQSIAEIPGCSSSRGSRALLPELSDCSWSFQMKRGSSRWFAFEIPADAAENMSVLFMARALSGRITMALWGPGSDPYRSVPTQVGTSYMEWPGLRESDQDASAAGGGHQSIASEQQYLFLARKDKPLMMGQYVVVVRADMGQPLVQVEVSTPSSMTQLIAEEQQALKELVSSCCPGLTKPDSSAAASPAVAASTGQSWCNTVGQAITYDLRQWYADICHVAPNVCDKDGHLRRLVIPPYALRCPEFPKSLAKFTRLQHVDISYSVAPGSLADVANVIRGLSQLQQLHLRGIGLSGPLSCELVQAGPRLQSLALSDNDKLSGTLHPCWLQSPTLQELQLAGLSGLTGPLPTLDGTSGYPAGPGRGLLVTRHARKVPGGASVYAARGALFVGAVTNTRSLLADAASEATDTTSGCGFGGLKYINMAGVIGDAEQGFTGQLPSSLGLCKDLLYLDLSGHALSGPLPALPEQLQYVNLSSNALSDVLPDFTGRSELQYVDLSFNRFRGSISDLTILQNLDWLDFSDNELTGTLPAVPLAVRWLDLSNNQLSGDIDLSKHGAVKPGASAELMMVLLNLSHNKFSGTLPVSLAVAPHLSFLDLSHNQLLGGLDTFAAALKPTNQMLQINLSHNKLVGGVPEQMQLLAALRPVMVTMSDGITPVHRILDLSHNQLGGVFPTWLIAVLPLLKETCHCTAGISLDAASFTCPDDVPQLAPIAQEMLKQFEALQCVSGEGSAAQQVPIWQVAGPSYKHYSREEHKALALQREQQQYQDPRRNRGTVAGIVLAAVAATVLVAVVVLAAVKYKRKQRDDKAVNLLLQHFDPYHRSAELPLGTAPSFEGMQALPQPRHSFPNLPNSQALAPAGPLGYNTGLGFAGGSNNQNNSLPVSVKGSDGGQLDDGTCEIALVVKKGSAGFSQTDGAQGSEPKPKGTDGLV